jgi:hypothetical protein
MRERSPLRRFRESKECAGQVSGIPHFSGTHVSPPREKKAKGQKENGDTRNGGESFQTKEEA